MIYLKDFQKFVDHCSQFCSYDLKDWNCRILEINENDTEEEKLMTDKKIPFVGLHAHSVAGSIFDVPEP